MDLNKELDLLDRAVKRGDVDTAVEIDTKLLMYENELKKGLDSMPKEHAETMSFYFKDWIMNIVDEIIFIAMIVLAFRIENELLAIIVGGVGAFFLISLYIARRKYTHFFSKDLWRMRNEKMAAQFYKLQLVQLQQKRFEHADFIEKSLNSKMGNMNDALSQIFRTSVMNKIQDLENEIESKKDNQSAEDK